MKTSLVVTVLNEEHQIQEFINSVLKQTKLPDEVIIVDGGSSDNTVAEIKNSKLKIQNDSLKFKILNKKGNRSIGRNWGIKNAKGDVILISDAGCVLEKNWIKNITDPFSKKYIDVVAGYYSAKPRNVFEKCLVPYVLVMPDKVKPRTFLPATRSMALRKDVWKKIGGFNENYSHNEDYVFSRRLKKEGYEIIFRKNAVVYWIPRKNLYQAFIMFFRFALGDAEAGILRPKVLFLILRYLAGLYLFFMYRTLFLILLLLYLLWSIQKNYKYVKQPTAFVFLPILQIVSDIAVLSGTLYGIIKRK